MNIRAKTFKTGTLVQPVVQVKSAKDGTTDGLSSIAVRREESRRSNSRASDRHRLIGETVRFSHEEHDHQGELINLSGGGAMIAGLPQGLRLWDRIDLTLGDHGIIECAVRWIRGNRVGLEFAHETQLHCSDDQRASVLRQAISRSFPHMAFEVPAGEHSTVPKEARVDENRCAPRHALIWWAVLHHDYQSTKVRIRNISAAGAMLEYNGSARVGAEPLLEFESGASISSTIAWSVGDHLGIRFHSDLDLDVLAKSAPQVTPADWELPAHLSKAKALGSPWDPHWNRLSVEQLQQELAGYLKY
jgi:hypothetical protein